MPVEIHRDMAGLKADFTIDQHWDKVLGGLAEYRSALHSLGYRGPAYRAVPWARQHARDTQRDKLFRRAVEQHMNADKAGMRQAGGRE